jgi:hypothetical protein
MQRQAPGFMHEWLDIDAMDGASHDGLHLQGLLESL